MYICIYYTHGIVCSRVVFLFLLGGCSCYCIITRRCAAAQLSHPKKAEDGSHCLSDMIWFAGWGIDNLQIYRNKKIDRKVKSH